MKFIWDFIKNLFKKISLRTWIEIILGVVLVLSLLFYYNRYKNTRSDLEASQNNNVAYQTELENANGLLVQYQFDIDQLVYFNDSITIKLRNAIKESGVKDKKIKDLQYQLTHFRYTDTIVLNDTIFCEPEFVLDTTIGDEWMSTDVHLEYPSTIGVTGKAKSERTVIFASRRETVDPPAKFFLCRWFQKKHTIIEVIVNEKNEHITSDTSRYIHIIND